jgi:predicted DNA-binding transcriptional regulator AlpA
LLAISRPCELNATKNASALHQKPKPDHPITISADMTSTADLTLIRFPEMSKILGGRSRNGGRSRSAIYEGIANGSIPPPIRLPGMRILAWRRSDVEAWIATAPVSASPIAAKAPEPKPAKPVTKAKPAGKRQRKTRAQ